MSVNPAGAKLDALGLGVVSGGQLLDQPFWMGGKMVLLLAFLLVLVFFGLGFALHFLWIVAVVLLVLWLVGFALGRGESAGSHRFYRW
jgi:hypothetical protein